MLRPVAISAGLKGSAIHGPENKTFLLCRCALEKLMPDALTPKTIPEQGNFGFYLQSMFMRSFFDHTSLGVLDAMHDHEGKWVNGINFCVQAGNLQSGHNGKEDVHFGSIAVAAFSKSADAFIDGNPPSQLFGNHHADFF